MVEIRRIELLTSWMPFKRSPSWAIPPCLGDVLYNIIDRSKNQPLFTKNSKIFLRRLSFENKCFSRVLTGVFLWSLLAGITVLIILMASAPQFSPYRLSFEERRMFLQTEDPYTTKCSVQKIRVWSVRVSGPKKNMRLKLRRGSALLSCKYFPHLFYFAIRNSHLRLRLFSIWKGYSKGQEQDLLYSQFQKRVKYSGYLKRINHFF